MPTVSRRRRPTRSPSPTAQSAQRRAAEATGGLGAEIVVTAQRREENLQRAAIAVSAVAGDTLTQQSVTQATDLTRLVPSLQVAPASSFTQIYLRGVGTFGANAFAEQGVAFNLDGVYLSRPAAPAGLFYDLERHRGAEGAAGHALRPQRHRRRGQRHHRSSPSSARPAASSPPNMAITIRSERRRAQPAARRAASPCASPASMPSMTAITMTAMTTRTRPPVARPAALR